MQESINTQKCSVCGILKPKIKTNRIKTRANGTTFHLYVDNHGKAWRWNVCRVCENKKRVLRHRITGKHQSVDTCQAHRVKLGRESERKVENYFKGLGYKIKLTDLLGPDLICEKDNFIITVEVKTISRLHYSWVAKKPTKKQTSCDYIAFVFNDFVFVRPMKDFIRTLNTSTVVILTNLINSIAFNKPHTKIKS